MHSLWWTHTAPTEMFSSVQQSELPLLPFPPLLQSCVCLNAWIGSLLLQLHLCTTGLYRTGGHTTKGTKNLKIHYIHIFPLYDYIFLQQIFQSYCFISKMFFSYFSYFFFFRNMYFLLSCGYKSPHPVSWFTLAIECQIVQHGLLKNLCLVLSLRLQTQQHCQLSHTYTWIESQSIHSI